MNTSRVMVIVDGAGKGDYSAWQTLKDAPAVYYETHTPSGMAADSLCCIMTLLGYSREFIPFGRAYLEAVSAGIPVGKTDAAFRLNGVDIRDGRLVSSGICRDVSSLRLPEGMEAFSLSAYRGLLVVSNASELADKIVTYPPHENIGRAVSEMKVRCPDNTLENELNSLYDEGFWPWGQSGYMYLPPYSSIHGRSGCVVTATEIVRGIAVSGGMACPRLGDVTADIDTSLSAKTSAVLEVAGRYDDIYVHINGADEASHRGDPDEKAAFMHRIEDEVIKPLLSELPDGTGLTVTSDHYTDPKTKGHDSVEVPVIKYN